MNEKPLISLNYFEFNCDSTLLDQVADEVQLLDNQKKIFWSDIYDSSLSSAPKAGYLDKEGNTSYYNQNLFKWVEECFNAVSNIKYGCGLKIVDSWLTRTEFLEASRMHSHSPSILSGVLYFDECSPIEFCHRDMFYDHINFFSDPKIVTTKIYPKKGDLIIFPSFIDHRITTNKNKNRRYSLAFNTFFTGLISNSKTARLTL